MERLPNGPVPEVPEGAVEAEEGGMPFDLRTLLISLWKRRFILIAIGIGSGIAGIAVALTFGSQVWKSQTILVYKGEDADYKYVGFGPPSLETQRSMVKTRENVEETIKRLRGEGGRPPNLAGFEHDWQRNALEQAVAEHFVGPIEYMDIPAYGSAVTTEVQRKTTLMNVTVQWNHKYLVTAFTNTLTDVFMDAQRKLRRADVENEIARLEELIGTVKKELDAADQELQDFTDQYRVVDLDRESGRYYDELTTVEKMYGEARLGLDSANAQIRNLNAYADKVKKQLEEETESSALLQGVREMQSRRALLEKAIDDDKDLRARQADLALKEVRYERARSLFEMGGISQKELEDAQNELEQAKLQVVDTPQIAKWKKEIDQIDEIADTVRNNPGMTIYEDLLMKEFDLRLEIVAHEEKLKYLETARREIEDGLYKLPWLKRKHVILNRELTAREQELELLENALAEANRNLETQAADFEVLTAGQIPLYPSKSKRKIMAAGVCAFGSMLGFGVVLLLILLDPRPKSDADLKIKLGLPVVGVFPRGIPISSLYPGEESGSEYLETFRIIARNVSRVIKKKGARILITSTYHGEGRTFIATTLAMCFGRRDERVLLVDAQVRSQEGGWEVRDLIPYKETWLKGLGEYLSFETHRVADVIWPSRLAGVECLPRVGEAVIPDLLGTNRMDELLRDVSRRYSLVLIDGPPVFPYVDADLLAKWSDGILLVVGSDKARLPAVRKAVARLQESGVPIVGVILNEVDPDYIDPALYGKDLDRSRLWPLDQFIPGLPRLFGRGKEKDEEE